MFWTFVDPGRITANEVLIEGQKAHHLGRVLRLRAGEEGIAVADGREHRVVVTAVRRDQILARIVSSTPISTEPGLSVTLLQSLLPNPDFDAVVEGATAVGISKLIAIEAARSLRRSGPERRSRWLSIAESAAEQSHRGRIPEIIGPMPLKAALESVSGPLLVLDPAAPHRLTSSAAEGHSVSLAVGPEGGWTGAELREFSKLGGRSVNLGPRILRARLAPVVATAILVAQS